VNSETSACSEHGNDDASDFAKQHKAEANSTALAASQNKKLTQEDIDAVKVLFRRRCIYLISIVLLQFYLPYSCANSQEPSLPKRTSQATVEPATAHVVDDDEMDAEYAQFVLMEDDSLAMQSHGSVC
jgi:hypothetical protein